MPQIKIAIIEAFSDDDFIGAPPYLTLPLTEECLDRLRKLNQLCKTEKLSVITSKYEEADFADSDDYALCATYLKVTPEEFWFRASAQEGEYVAMTRRMSLEQLESCLQEESSYHIVADGSFAEDIAAEYESDLFEALSGAVANIETAQTPEQHRLPLASFASLINWIDSPEAADLRSVDLDEDELADIAKAREYLDAETACVP